MNTAGSPVTPEGVEAAILARGLEKSFGLDAALDGVDLTMAHGGFVVVFGPNGAGKTTLTRCLATLTRPSAGTISIFGTDLADAGAELRGRLGVVSHQSFLYDALTPTENLLFFARMFGVEQPLDRARAALDRVGLADRAADPVRELSRGLRQRCSIARALVHDPDLLLFDEPFAGLDPVAADGLSAILRGAHEGGTSILMTSHDLDRGRELADDIAILHRGSLVHMAPAAGTSSQELGETYREVTRDTLR